MKNQRIHTLLVVAALTPLVLAGCSDDAPDDDSEDEPAQREYSAPYTSNDDVDWAVDTGATYARLPAVDDDGGLVVGDWNGTLRRIDADSGDETFSYEASGRIDTAPAVADDGRMYVGDWSGVVHAVNPDGTEAWTYDAGAIVDTSPSIDAAGRIWVADNAGQLHVLSPDGDLEQDYDLGSSATTSVSIYDGESRTAYVGTEDDRIHCIDEAGSIETADLAGHARFDLALTPQGRAIATMDNGVVAAVNADCQTVWDEDVTYGTVMPAIISEDGDIWAWARNRALYLLDGETGSVDGQFDHLIRANATTGGTLADDGRLLVGTRGIVGFREDGDSTIRTEVDVMDAPVLLDGAAFATTERGALVRLAGTWPQAGESSWPTQHGNLKRTGRLEP